MREGLKSAWRPAVMVAGALGLAAGAVAQTTQTTQKVQSGAPKTTTVQVKGELVAKGANWLIAKDVAGNYALYHVQPGRQAMVDGVPKTLDQLALGTMLTSTATTTELPVTKRTANITKGEVVWASPTSIVVAIEGGETKEYAVPDGFKFEVDGKQVSAMDLKRGMKVSAIRIVEVPDKIIMQNIVVTGTAPK